MIHDDAGARQRNTVLREAAAAPWAIGSLAVSGTKADVLHDDVVGFELHVVAADDDTITRSGLPGERELVVVEFQGGGQLNVAGHIENHRARTGLAVGALT